jgi:hypothetical protein
LIHRIKKIKQNSVNIRKGKTLEIIIRWLKDMRYKTKNKFEREFMVILILVVRL